MSTHILSKSTYMRGIKCPKSLYLNKHGKALRDEISDSQEFIFEQGTEVGLLAQELFPKGIDCSPESFYDYGPSIQKTKELIDKGQKVIYEASFQFDGVLCAMDILVKSGDGYKAYEVKSSTSISDTYIQDGSLQYYVMMNCGINIKDISIVYINNQYVRKGKVDVEKLFTSESILSEVLELQKEVPANIKAFKKLLDSKAIPQVDIGPHCGSPYPCDFMGHCWKHVPEYSVFDISRLRSEKKFEMYSRGIMSFEQITEDVQGEFLNHKQIIQVKSELEQTIVIERDPIKEFINDLSYPLYFLDFETMQTAIPLYDNCRPYQMIVFQYSMHKLNTERAELEHFEFLADPKDGDPRLKFIKQLMKDCGVMGDILTYNIAFERTKVKELIADYPEYEKPLENIANRMKDLMIPFQQRWYYKPEMRGSYSIKKVLPALVPELSYEDLEIQEGGTASAVYAQMATGGFDGDIDQTRKALLAYCNLDTYAMVMLLNKLKEI
jgi:hypothetical protein